MSERISRSELISLIAGVPLAVVVTAAAAEAADTPQAVQTKKALAYVDKSPKKDQICGNCQFYKGINGTTGNCQLIPGGQVKKAGWCKSWAKKA